MSRTFRTALAAITLGGALVAPALVAAPASAATRYVKSTVTIAGFNGADAEAVRFFGKVASPKAFCKRGRSVTLRQVDQGLVAGKDRTNRRGKWVVVFDGNTIDPGTFKAIVAKKVVKKNGNRFVCKPDTVTYEVGGKM